MISKHKKTNKKRKTEPEGSIAIASKLNPYKVFELYNRLCPGLVKANLLDKKRKNSIRTRLTELGDENMLKMLEAAGRSPFLAGNNTNGWKAGIDWLMKPANFMKVLEGNFDPNPGAGKTAADYHCKPSSLELLEEAYKNIITDEKYRDID